MQDTHHTRQTTTRTAQHYNIFTKTGTSYQISGQQIQGISIYKERDNDTRGVKQCKQALKRTKILLLPHLPPE